MLQGFVWWDILNFARNFFERNWRSAPPPLASLAVPQKSFLRNFLFCARPIFSSKRKRKLFCWPLLWTSRAAGLRFGSGEAEFPPHPPSASPSLWTAIFSAGLCSFSSPLPARKRLRNSLKFVCLILKFAVSLYYTSWDNLTISSIL